MVHACKIAITVYHAFPRTYRNTDSAFHIGNVALKLHRFCAGRAKQRRRFPTRESGGRSCQSGVALRLPPQSKFGWNLAEQVQSSAPMAERMFFHNAAWTLDVFSAFEITPAAHTPPAPSPAPPRHTNRPRSAAGSARGFRQRAAHGSPIGTPANVCNPPAAAETSSP